MKRQYLEDGASFVDKQNTYVTRPLMQGLDEYVDEIRDIWTSRCLTNMGSKHRELKEKLKEYLDVENIELFTNGHMSLELTLQAFKLKGEVITTPFTFASTVHAIVRNGLTPVFCDIDPVNYTMDTDKLEGLITENTSAIVPVHVYGNICDTDKIQKIADRYGLKVIYDAAHAFGERINGRSVASFGDASCFSFHATKVFNSIEGGASAFHDKKIGEALYELKNFGIKGPEEITGIGANAKMNEFCAAFGICNLRHLDKEIAGRRRIYEKYCSGLEGIRGITFNQYSRGLEPNYAYFPILIDPEKYGKDRDALFHFLEERGIFTRKYFYPLASQYECYKGRFDSQKTPVALQISSQVLTLPMYGDLKEEKAEQICNMIKEYREKG